jgi:CRISPR/Cas system-associated endoribonuclease Cas2
MLMVVLLSLLAAPPLVAQERDPSALNVSIVVFDPGVPAQQSLHRDLQVFPRIREIEALFLPFVLRETLANTNEWGAVRVVPEIDTAAELMLSCTIVDSDGDQLNLHVRAADASGRVWFERSFAAAVGDSYASRVGQNAVRHADGPYGEIAASLREARAQLDDKLLSNIIEISLLRHAAELAPSAFGDYLRQTDDGMFSINRLPAKGDPMLERIDRIRGVEYVITDAVDAKYQEMHVDIAAIYDLWREYRRKAVQYQVDDAERVQNSTLEAPSGSYEAIRALYDNYKSDRIIAQEQDSLAVAFNNEVGPKIAAMEARVAELDGWVEERYAEWRRLLEELFEVETGLTP